MIAFTVCGVLIVVATGVDLALTMLHPTRSGYVSAIATSVTWRVMRFAARKLRKDAIAGYAGPVMMLAQLASWVLGLWLGFALIYAGSLDQLDYTLPGSDDSPGFVDALYFSGVALSTVGFGDIVAQSDSMRLVSAAEAALGLAVFGAAISYLLTVYPLVSEIRTIARHLSSAQDHHGAAELVAHGGQSRLDTLERDLIRLDESTQRFPILYYFHAHDPTASLGSVIRATSLITMQLRWGIATQSAPYARWYGGVLEGTLTRVTEHLAGRYHRLGSAAAHSPPTSEQVDSEWRAARAAAADVTRIEAEDEIDVNSFAEHLRRFDRFLRELEREHLYAPPRS
ncbi:potassium channel family protein [Demequina sp. TTPB684]|uniref:potassium channel family protein n=1 Tax=unclassified Demequina TaxID=2620311 RepID=UPI001CF35E1B|nr:MULTISPECIES: potassium channel family protein [unclassified Demequina]MCB2413267.1 potassium channel family protein [Demequina sp. TTPB684]UPU88727.1 potassium channel family protein [Demequina sp. TMPB413]